MQKRLKRKCGGLEQFAVMCPSSVGPSGSTVPWGLLVWLSPALDRGRLRVQLGPSVQRASSGTSGASSQVDGWAPLSLHQALRVASRHGRLWCRAPGVRVPGALVGAATFLPGLGALVSLLAMQFT